MIARRRFLWIAFARGGVYQLFCDWPRPTDLAGGSNFDYLPRGPKFRLRKGNRQCRPFLRQVAEAADQRRRQPTYDRAVAAWTVQPVGSWFFWSWEWRSG